MKTRFYYYVWQYAPVSSLRYWAWGKWLDTQWVYPEIQHDPHLDR